MQMKRHATDDATRYSISIRHSQNQDKMGFAFCLMAGPIQPCPLLYRVDAISIQYAHGRTGGGGA
jgi:hypothetical protein